MGLHLAAWRFKISNPENFPPRERGRDQFDFAVGARRGRNADIFVHRDGHDQPFVVIGVIPKQLQPARRPGHMRGSKPEMLLE